MTQYYIITDGVLAARRLEKAFENDRATVQHVVDLLATFMPSTPVKSIELQMEAHQLTITEPTYDMVIFCPACHQQHIDAPEPCRMCDGTGTRISPKGAITSMVCNACDGTGQWTNRPHKSHTCHYCGIVFRLADFCTNGVAEIKTKGKDDTWQN